MKTVFLAGSRRFSDNLENVFKLLEKAGISAIKGRDNTGILNREDEMKAHQEMLRRIDKSDMVYIVSGDGYIGKTVALEIGYAIGKKKEVISSIALTEAEANSFISKVMNIEELIEYIKHLYQ